MTADNWLVYIIRCRDNSLYTGITTDLERRFAQHAGGRGARYFRGHEPVEVVYHESGHSRSSASRREAAIKKLKTADKWHLVREKTT
ncbi:GIY-YIG nuclease family protein [uncultured Desulfuromonas sp.]|uniref:GIY-YIG nuclease family protein n=1 Tax=uncultured Desulfuromonas sp. TaxID=181013 RepID=UPI002AAAEDE2|nr:GIY-YIG nuclease family protein [uncultured Desulfuromonas sp.]